MTGRAVHWIVGVTALLLSDTAFTRTFAGHSSSSLLKVQEDTPRKRLLRKRSHRNEIIPSSRFIQQATTTTTVDWNLNNESSRDLSGQQFGFEEEKSSLSSSFSSLEIPLEDSFLKNEGKAPSVVGGKNAEPDDAPFFVLIMTWNSMTNNYVSRGCGGSLISNRHVLTAAHCVVDRNPQLDAVYVHAYQPFWGNPGVPFHYSRVSSYTIHPDFENHSLKADLAIITMSLSVDVLKFPPISLPPSALFQTAAGDIANVYGFGQKGFNNPSQVTTLRVVDVPIVSPENCREIYGSNRILDDMVCAGWSMGKKDACSGDSGGPLIVKRNNIAYQVGIVSWGEGCGKVNRPGVYTSVQYFYKWIQDTVCKSYVFNVKSPLCD